MAIPNDTKVFITRDPMDYRVAATTYGKLDDVRWQDETGGVHTKLPQAFICANVSCSDIIEGEIAHSGTHGIGPHNIIVFITKKDNANIYEELKKVAGPNPNSPNALPLSSKKVNEFAQSIVTALLTGTEHVAITFHEKRQIYYIDPRNIPEVKKGGTYNTVNTRSKKIRKQVELLLSDNTDWEQTQYGHLLAYKKRN